MYGCIVLACRRVGTAWAWRPLPFATHIRFFTRRYARAAPSGVPVFLATGTLRQSTYPVLRTYFALMVRCALHFNSVDTQSYAFLACY